MKASAVAEQALILEFLETTFIKCSYICYETLPKKMIEFRKIYEKNFGLIYNVGMVIFSWVFFFFLKGQLVSSARTVIFFPDEIIPDTFTATIIIIAVVCELIGSEIRIKRIRHIITEPGEYGEFYKKSSSKYTSDLIFFHFMAVFATRIFLSALMGYILFALMGFMGVLGSLLLITKDIFFFILVSKNIDKPLKEKVPKVLNLFSNILLMFSGFVFLSVGWETFGRRYNEILCTITNWQGFGDFILGMILLSFFYFLMFYPTRIAYQFEEITFTDSKQEERKLMLYYLYSIFFAIIPWLI